MFEEGAKNDNSAWTGLIASRIPTRYREKALMLAKILNAIQELNNTHKIIRMIV